MTGFGRGNARAGERTVVVEVRAGNHRYLDVAVRTGREHVGLEPRLRSLVAERVRRGRVDLTVAVPAGTASGRTAAVDTALASQYYRALREMCVRLRVPGRLDATALAALPGVCTVVEAPPDADADWPAVAAAAGGALEDLEAMRAREGAALAEALEANVDRLRHLLAEVADRAPDAAGRQRDALAERMRALLGDPSPASAEAAARILERADIQEEIVRCGSHLDQVQACLAATDPVGRRLDILAQELQREWTTISGKAVDSRLAGWAVEARVAVEQMREQVQNVE